jgi:hypothetical protein
MIRYNDQTSPDHCVMPSSRPLPSPAAASTQVSRSRLAALTTLAMFAFAGNSLLCRVALKATAIDPATFTSVRILAAAATLWLIQRSRTGSPRSGGDWYAAFALIVYAAAFSFAYVGLPAGTGALLLFGAVQAWMIGYALWSGERLRARQWLGVTLALAGLVGLVLPGLAAPPLFSSLLMLAAGVAWGVYSVRGKRAADPGAGGSRGCRLRAAIGRDHIGARLCDLVRGIEGTQSVERGDRATERAADRRAGRHRAIERTVDVAAPCKRRCHSRRHRARHCAQTESRLTVGASKFEAQRRFDGQSRLPIHPTIQCT